MVDPANIEDCQWVKISNGSNKGTITIFKEKFGGSGPLLSLNQRNGLR